MSDEVQEYTVVKGIIQNPGMFEGEPYWMPTLWDMVLGGMADESLHDGTTAYDAFALDSDLEKLTGIKPVENSFLVIWRDDNGFIYHMFQTREEMNNLEPVNLEEPDLIDSDFDGDTQEWYGSCLPVGFDDHPEYDSGY